MGTVGVGERGVLAGGGDRMARGGSREAEPMIPTLGGACRLSSKRPAGCRFCKEKYVGLTSKRNAKSFEG